LVGESQARLRFLHDVGDVSHAPAVFLLHGIFGEPAHTSIPWAALCFVFLVQWALYSAIAFGIFRLIRYAQRHAAS
jgi:hypothetical protein